MTSNASSKRPRGRPATRTDTPRKARAEQVEEIDLHIGLRIRAARTMRNMTREDLAARLGLGPQTIEKYERGESRVLSARLWAIARILDVEPNFFFADFVPGRPSGSEELMQAMTVGNMQIVRDLRDLTYDQRAMVRQMIDTMLNANRAAAEAVPAGAGH